MNAPAQMSNNANAYLKTRVMTASPEELRLMLLDGAIKFCRQGREALEKQQWEAAHNGVSQCRDIIFELMTTIREEFDPDLASKTKALYSFMYRTLVEGKFEKDLGKIDTVISLLEFERETWIMLMAKLAEERGVRPANAPAPAERAPLSIQA